MGLFEKARAVIVGHAVADALGVPVEFNGREWLRKNPVTEMTGYGTHPVPAGAWSDDTTMALCALDTIYKDREIDFESVMINFTQWYYADCYTPTGKLFDIGNTCAQAIENYFVKGVSPTSCGQTGENSNGNGSLMRIHPFTLHLYGSDMSIEDKISIIHKASALTHGHQRSLIGCGIYSFILWELLSCPEKESVYKGLARADEFYKNYGENQAYERLYNVIGNKDIVVTEDGVRSSGYVVDSLEAAVWCLLTTDSYKECVLKAVNLGEDTDTVGAIAGGLAGALYGYDSIPREWLNTLIKLDYIEQMCEKAYK
ncbi:MAG: ADP-ribosylglycohydrolase family protein [Clostridia bacterium]|nr:ADP-ribosylglycohydrolase family protein [Clostridia bacterium]